MSKISNDFVSMKGEVVEDYVQPEPVCEVRSQWDREVEELEKLILNDPY